MLYQRELYALDVMLCKRLDELAILALLPCHHHCGLTRLATYPAHCTADLLHQFISDMLLQSGGHDRLYCSTNLLCWSCC